jgi:eukaryotic-like serine/threonine-protein kinase
VITLTLLHPDQQTPVQVWTFENESVIRIGRATDNHVILYSAVVSRHHVELRQIGSNWEIVNLGANGTYLNGKRVDQVSVEDGAIIRLARSGPNIQIRLGEATLPNLPKSTGVDRSIHSATSNSLSITEINHYNSAEPQNSALLDSIVSWT